MNIALPALGVSFMAFAIWLTLRIINRRERWAKWTLSALIGLPVLYVASFGPACWITGRTDFGWQAVPIVYRPLTWTFSIGSMGWVYTSATGVDVQFRMPRYSAAPGADWIGESLQSFTRFGAAENWIWGLSPNNLDQGVDPVELEWVWIEAAPAPVEDISFEPKSAKVE